MRRRILAATLLLLSTTIALAAEPGPKIVLIAGKKSHGPGHHEYENGCRLLAETMKASPSFKAARIEVHPDGWPRDPGTLEDAATILIFSDGSDHRREDHPLLLGDRLATLRRLMEKGVGLVAIHYSLFVPTKEAGEGFLDWLGGYFDYENGPPPRNWASKITHCPSVCIPATPGHPVCRGLRPFPLTEEYYHAIRFPVDRAGWTPILTAKIPSDGPDEVIAWAKERPNGGRGFGFTGGHFHSNWASPPFRRLVLNALAWTAKIDVPANGVEATLPPTVRFIDDDPKRPIEVVIVTGDQHPAHDWKTTTTALLDILGKDTRFRVKVIENPELLTREDPKRIDVVLLNYVNSSRPAPGDDFKRTLTNLVQLGKGLVLVHFANGAFRDWPEYRQLSRRVWVDNKSGHDAYGRFRVDIAKPDHPLTQGMKPYETTDELYFAQQGEAPIDPLVTAKSKVTGKDEPMAYLYGYGDGWVFQTLLGHDAASIRSPGTADLIRRGVAYVARRQPIGIVEPTNPISLRTKGRFGQGVDPSRNILAAATNAAFEQPPLTVECWVKLRSKSSYNILVACNLKRSSHHWEIFTMPGTGRLAAYLPGYSPAQFEAPLDICDDQWRHVAFVLEADRARLYVDGKAVADQRLTRGVAAPESGPLYVGAYPPGGIRCDGIIDEVKISRGALLPSQAPSGPTAADDKTLALWRFEEKTGDRFSSAAASQRPLEIDPPFARLGEEQPAAPANAKAEFKLADPGLAAVVIDRSPADSFLSMTLDTTGRLFVGGREALFVYEPKRDGGFEPRRLLYRFPRDSWLSGLAIRGDDLYVMTSSALYLLPGARIKREGIVPQRLIWGLPLDLHVSYHALAWGPEGKLYFNAGDPLLNHGDFERRPDHWGHWTVYSQPDDKKNPFTGVGGFFRCQPDGSGFEVIATGTRGCFGLCFDKTWTLFSNDNDHESIAAHYSPARLLHVTDGVDFGWPRGWMAEKTPERADLVETMLTTLGREAPVGQVTYDDPLLPEKYRGTILLARWGQRRVDAYRYRPRGASYAAEEVPFFIGENMTRPVGVAVGQGGRVFVSVSLMRANEWSPAYPTELVMITSAKATPGHPFAAYDAPTAPLDRLFHELSSSSLTRREAAHVELLRRGGEALAEATRRYEKLRDGDPAAMHLPWIAAASGSEEAERLVRDDLQSADAARRKQAVAILARHSIWQTSPEVFAKILGDTDASIALAAIEGIAKRDEPLPESLYAGPAKSKDSYLRQVATRLIARRGDVSQIERLFADSDAAGRLAGVLAAGTRLTVPAVDDVPPDSLPLNYASANAVFAIAYADGTIDLKSRGRVGSYTSADRWNRLPRTADQERLFALLAARLRDEDDTVRRQAAFYLDLLDDERTRLDVVRARQSPAVAALAKLPARPIAELWSIGPFLDQGGAFAPAHPPEQGPIDLTSPSSGGLTWKKFADPSGAYSLPAAGAAGSTYFLVRLVSRRPELIALDVRAPSPFKSWLNGRPLAETSPLLVSLQPGGNDLLLRVKAGATSGRVGLAYKTTGDVLARAAEPVGSINLAERLKSAPKEGGEIPAAFLAVDWSAAAKQGDAAQGRRLFSGDGLGCAKCHAIRDDQNIPGAPSLASAGKRFTVPHIVESILTPHRQVADLFQATTLVLSSGEVLTGLVVSESNDSLDILLPNTARRAIPRGEIEERRKTKSSPMPNGLVRTPQELRDLLAYLVSDNPLPP